MIGYDRKELAKISLKQAFWGSMGVGAAACRQLP